MGDGANIAVDKILGLFLQDLLCSAPQPECCPVSEQETHSCPVDIAVYSQPPLATPAVSKLYNALNPSDSEDLGTSVARQGGPWMT